MFAIEKPLPRPTEDSAPYWEAARKGAQNDLGTTAALAGWATPSAAEFRTMDSEKLEKRRQMCRERTGNGNGSGLTLGNQATLYIAETGSTGVLNPALPRWLQGFPLRWDETSPDYSAWQEATALAASRATETR